jgi:hypothetical protein
VSREAVLGTGDLRSADPGDLSAARGALGDVPCAALGLGTAGLRALGVGGVPFFSGGGLLLIFVSAWPDLRSKKPNRDESTSRRLYLPTRPRRPARPGTRTLTDGEPEMEAQKGAMGTHLPLEPCIASSLPVPRLRGALFRQPVPGELRRALNAKNWEEGVVGERFLQRCH